MARSIVVLLLALAGCASPETRIDIAYDPATKLVTANLERSWLGGPCAVTGRYHAPDGTEVEFTWISEVDLGAALADRADTRKAIIEAADKLAVIASKVP